MKDLSAVSATAAATEDHNRTKAAGKVLNEQDKMEVLLDKKKRHRKIMAQSSTFTFDPVQSNHSLRDESDSVTVVGLVQKPVGEKSEKSSLATSAAMGGESAIMIRLRTLVYFTRRYSEQHV